MFRKMKTSYSHEEREIFVLPLKKLLCPTDFSEPSREALKVAVEFALHFGAQLSLVNVVPMLPVLPRDPNYAFKVPEYEQMLHADAEERLNELIGEVTMPRHKHTHHRGARRRGQRNRSHRGERECGYDRDCHARNDRVAPRGIRLSCREGGTTGQMSGANDSSFSGRAVRSVWLTQ